MEIINYPIKPEKEKAWHFKSHQYFTKQAHNVVNEYIRHFSNEGDTILDPFCGTGVTAIEALLLKRKAIMIDLNPLACFITKWTCRKINISKFQEAYQFLSDKVEKKIESYYSLPFDEAQNLKPEYWFPENVKLPKNSDFEFVQDLYTPRQLTCYSLIYHEIQNIQDEEAREMMRYVFSAVMAKVNLTYWTNANRGEEGGGASIFGAYRYHRPDAIYELDVWKNFKARYKYILKGKQKWNELTTNIDVNDNLTVINASVLDIQDIIPENSIDYCYTDPPYGGNIAYLDLSIMWNAWLGFQVTEENFKNEIIEGGDLDKTSDDYSKLFRESIEKISSTVKKDGWVSCVFAHKKLEYWNVIIDSFEDSGLEFKGSAFQPTNNSSVHYKKNPANVLCSQRIASFQKTHIVSHRQKPDDLQEFILNEMERACVEEGGSSIDRIYQRVLDRLLHNKTIGEAKKKGYLKLDKFLDDEDIFLFNPETNLYYVKDVKEVHKSYAESYLRNKDEIKLFLIELLTNNSLTISQIHKELFEIFEEDKKFPLERSLSAILTEIAYQDKTTKKYSLIKGRGEQTKLEFDNVLSNKLIKVIPDEQNSHSETIFRLVIIGQYLGFKSWIGKREQATASFNDMKFSDLSIEEFPLKNLTDTQIAKIQQIDVIWFDKHNIPRYGFEVEESTSIVSGFERFMNLLEVDSTISNHLYIVAPTKRKRKLIDIFKHSSYIGHPIYLENKVGFIYKEKLVSFYDKYVDKDFTEADLKTLFNKLEVN